MQQQTRQRTTRQRQSTPLPEKRGRTRQTTRRRHANTTHRHMVNTHRHSNKRKTEERGKAGSGREKRQGDRGTKETQWCSGTTCVLAGLRAHYPEHQQHKDKGRQRKTKEDRKTRRQGRERSSHTTTTAIPQPHNTIRQDKTRCALPSHTTT